MERFVLEKRFNTKRFLRKLHYHLLCPKVPVHTEPFKGPVLVVGSAPGSHLPEGFDDRFRVITVNGSQSVTKRWGIPVPDVTFMQFRQVYGMNENAREVRRVLNGERTRLLYVMRWPENRRRLTDGLDAFNYGYDRLQTISRYERMALFKKATGILNSEDDLDTKFSNGVTAVLYALINGATCVVISGIDPASSGHVYNALELTRHHSQSDRDILLLLSARGHKIYTADPDVAVATGLPLWTEKTRAVHLASKAVPAIQTL